MMKNYLKSKFKERNSVSNNTAAIWKFAVDELIQCLIQE